MLLDLAKNLCVLFTIVGLVVIVSIQASAQISTVDGKVTVDTSRYTVVFEGPRLLEIHNKLTGEKYNSLGQASQLAMVRTTSSDVWLECVETEVVAQEEDYLKVALFPRRFEGEVYMEFLVDPVTEDLSIRLASRIESTGLYGIRWGFDVDNKELTAIIPGKSIGFQMKNTSPDFVYYLEWPTGWLASLAILQGESGGFSIWADDLEMHYKGLFIDKSGGYTGLAFESRNTAPFRDKAEITSVDWCFNVYKGDWRVPAERFRSILACREDNLTLEQVKPDWIGKIRFIVTTWNPIESILQPLAEAVNPEETIIYCPGWREDSYDRNYPRYIPSQAFKRFAEKARELGFRVMVHVNLWGADPIHPDFDILKQYQLRDGFTGEALWWTWASEPPIKFAFINPAAPIWREILVANIVAAYKDVEFDAIHVDQAGEVHNDSNGLINDMNMMQGTRKLLSDIRAALPNVALGVEMLNEISMTNTEFAQVTIWGVDWGTGQVDRWWSGDIHPIVSYMFSGFNHMYAHLGIPNPDSAEKAWNSVESYFDNAGVLPTLKIDGPTVIGLPGSNSEILLKEASAFQKFQLKPEFSLDWPEDVKFMYKGKDGVKGYYKGGIDKTQLIIEYADGLEEVVMERRRPQDASGYRASGYTVFYNKKNGEPDYRSVYDALTVGPIVRTGRVQQKSGVGEYYSWNHEMPIDFAAAEYDRQDCPVVFKLDLQNLIEQAGGGTLDPNSIRLVEVTPAGDPIKEVSSQYDVFSDGRKELAFVSEGKTSAYTLRKYKLYFDSMANGPKPQPRYDTGLKLDTSSMVVENQDMKVELNKENGLIKSVYLKAISNEIPSFTADDAWLDIGCDGGAAWYGLYQRKGRFEIVTSGPVRIIVRSVADTGEYSFEHGKEYEIFYKGSQIHYALDISMEGISLNSAAESMRLWFDSDTQWKYSFFDGSGVVTSPIPDSPQSIEGKEDWLSVHNDEFGLQYVMVENYAPNAFFLGTSFAAASRGLILPSKNVYPK